MKSTTHYGMIIIVCELHRRTGGMTMQIDISEFATTEEKLLELSDTLESIKSALEEIIDDLDCDDKETDSLEEASELIDDAIDAIGDAVDDLEEEELELDEDADDEADDLGGLHIGVVLKKN